MLFYLTPVFYVRGSVPEQFRWVLDLNPMATVIEAYRALLLGGPGPSAALVAVLVAASGVLAVVGYAVFRRLQPSFADHL